MDNASAQSRLERVSICRCCSVACGIIVSLEGERVVDVRGDPDHPLSRGYTCPKGRGLPQFHHHPDRLLEPLAHGRPVDWGAGLDEVASRCRELIDQYGAGSIGFYTGTGQRQDSNGFVVQSRFFDLLGCSQHYSATTVDIAPALRAAELVIGSARVWPLWLPEEDGPSLLLIIGMNPVVSHGYTTPLTDPVRRLRDYRRAGGQVWVVDPRLTETARLADHHLALRPGSDALILAWLVRELLISGADRDELERYCDPLDVEKIRRAVAPFDLSVVARASGVEPAVLTTLLASIRQAGKIAAISATGVTFNEHALVAEWLRWVLLIITGSLDCPGGMPFDPGWVTPLEQRTEWPISDLEPGPASRPEFARYFGQVPCVAMVDEIESGTLRGLFIAGGNPLTAFPDPDRTRAALRSLDLVVVLDLVASDLTKLATHVLPCAGQLERTDVTSRGRVMYVPALVPPCGNTKPSWWVYAQLGHRLGLDVLDGIDPDSCTDEILIRQIASQSRGGADALIAAGPHGLPNPSQHGWLHERILPVLPHGCWRLAPEVLLSRLPDLLKGNEPDGLVLVSRREVTRVNSVPYADARRPDHDALLMHPQDAVQSGITHGDRVLVTSDTGSIEAIVSIDERCREGVVSMNHGLMNANVDHLVSRMEYVDQQTGQPVMTGIPVTITSANSVANTS